MVFFCSCNCCIYTFKQYKKVFKLFKLQLQTIHLELSRCSFCLAKCSTNPYPTNTMHMIVMNIASAAIDLSLYLISNGYLLWTQSKSIFMKNVGFYAWAALPFVCVCIKPLR
jgi:hypothetical protein